MTKMCIDIGATKTLFLKIDELVDSWMRISTDIFLDDMEDMLKKASDGYLDNVDTAAVGAIGPMDVKKGVLYPPNRDEEIIPIVDLLSDYFDDIVLLNDCHAGVIGEYAYGEEKSENMVYITYSTGIGAGVIADGHLLRGGRGNFAEAGHLHVGGKLPCGCGGKGHWEAYCGGKNLINFVGSLTGLEYDDPKEVFEDYHSGDEKIIGFMEEYQRLNAVGVENVIRAYDPELIVIGGVVALNHPGIFIDDTVQRLQEKNGLDIPKIVPASLGEYSVIEGLRAVVKNEFDLER